MSPVSFQAIDKNLEHVFCADYLFEVPGYQRPYSWKTEHAQALFDDILEFVCSDGNGKKITELPAYFLGSILLIKKTSDPKADIVDGQQRLTTLTILLSAIRSLHNERAVKEAITEVIYQKGNKVTGAENIYRLKLRELDQKFFQEYIQTEDGFERLLALNEQLKDSQENIRANARLFAKKLGDLTSEQMTRLAGFIITRCYLVVVTTPDIDSAYRIFSVLNSRGLDLSVADILKSKVLGKIITGDKRAEYTKKWEDMEEELSRDAFSDLISYLRMIFKKSKPKETLLKDFGDYLEEYVKGSAKGAMGFVDEYLSPAYEAYYQITKSNFNCSDSKYKKEVDIYLHWLNKLDFNAWVPPAINFLIKKKNDTSSVYDFFRKMESLAYGMMLMKNTVNERIERFSRITQCIDDEKYLIHEDDSPLNLTLEEQKEIYRLLKDAPIYEYLSARNRTTLLLRLDSLLSNGEARYDYSTISVEHVLPQSPKAKSQWLTWFSNKKQRENVLHKLGNLALLTKRKNSEASNYDFETKKEKYFQSANGVSTFALTTQVLCHDEWTLDTFQLRHAQLVNCLATHWELN